MITRFLDIPDETPNTDNGADTEDQERDTLRDLFGQQTPTEPGTGSAAGNDPVPSAGRAPAKAPYQGKSLTDWLRGW